MAKYHRQYKNIGSIFMVSEEYLKQLMILVDLSDTKYEKFKNKIQEVKKEETIIIYGAGGGGQWLLELLSRYAIRVIAFFDSDPEKWNNSVKGLPVCNPEKNPIKNSNNALIIIALRNSKAQIEVLNYLGYLGYTNVILYSQIWNNFIYDPDVDIKKMFDTNKLIKVAKLWKDQKSSDVFIDAIRFHTIYNHEMNNELQNGIQYFPEDVPMKRKFDCFIDCGAYTGDTIMELYNKFGKVKKIIAFEPDSDNFLKLSQYLKTNSKKVCDQLLLYPCGVWSETTQMRFSDRCNASSAITSDGESMKQFVALDEVIFNIKPEFIKMDVEGAEVEALQGAKEMICLNKPDLAICLYHRIDHLWDIALLINNWNLGYDFYIRRHDYAMEIVMYATVMDERYRRN